MFRRVAEVAAWSMKWASMGRWPDAGFDGKPFATGSARAKMCGQPLADGFRYLGSQGKHFFLQLNGFYQLFYCTTWGLSNTDMFHNNPEDCIIYLSVNPTYLSVLLFYFFIYFFLDPTYLYLDLDLS